ncbi:MAG: glutamyl-tRNA synthetase [Parcubacteria group bacterium Greene0714_21]|nr:MAG: glutamyl-tRNA synthetase [Parcubacteria group bacterium Greene0416_39]TSC98501.1 MAG: glutamyl-tRNA synthetase [Parcubacteria group bacterium Greene1014_47]TSD04263.1 MAG: glutamyl-tRNA synthetase [Parcubacteria group bacterium Greene0714_21]
MKKVRTRFAPSPTGALHMGNVRAALFNYLFAKHTEGTFVLRIEDTDKERSKPEWEQDIVDNLTWLGLEWDEFYRQSERTEIYAKYLTQLLTQGKAYYCFCKEEDLEAQRQDQLSRGVAPSYKGTCRTLTPKELEKNLQEKKPCVIRFLVPAKIVSFHDLIRGQVKFDAGLMGDIVIAKDLTTPLYNFSVVVDDFEMTITHVIRGEDHISNTPKQILLQEALGFTRPAYAHLPLVLGGDRTKLSKRHGDNSVTQFRIQGYLPEAIVNFLVLLGWNPGDNRELFTLEELVKEFSLERVHKGGAVFNPKRLDWINGSYIRKKSLKELAEFCKPYLESAGFDVDLPLLEKVVSLYQERLKKLSEIVGFADFFFKDKLSYPKDMLRWKKYTEKDAKDALEQCENIAASLKADEWTKEKLEQVFLAKATMGDRGYLLWPLRVALSGKEASAGPFEIASVLGKEKTVERIQEAIQLLS